MRLTTILLGFLMGSLSLLPLTGAAMADDKGALLKVAYDTDPVSLDIHEQLSIGMLQLSHLAFDPLVRWNRDLQLEPRLAADWERLDDTTMRLHQVEPYLRATSWLVGEYFQALERGEVDLALCYWPEGRTALDIDLSGVRYLEIGEERLIPVCLADADGQPRFALPGHKREPVPHIAYHPSGLIAAALQAHWGRSRQEVHLSTLNENVQTSNIRELVQQGYGLGWLPWRTVRHLLETGELTRAGDQRWDVPLSLRLYFRQDSRHPTLPGLLTRLAAAR